MTFRRLTALAAVAATAGAGLVTLVSLAPASATTTAPPIKLIAPLHSTAYLYGKRAYLDVEVSIAAEHNAIEVISHRANWNSKITSELTIGGTSTALPPGTMHNFSGLSGFFSVTMTDSKGKTVLDRTSTACLNGDTTQRVHPGGAAHSLYPSGCPTNIFTKGSVQGIARGWASTIDVLGYRAVKLAKGTYTMTLSVTPKYQQLFGLTAQQATRTISVTVKKGGRGVEPVPAHSTGAAMHLPSKLNPNKRLSAPPPGSPEPDLEALPAWGIGVSKDGNHLNFSATVWNGGDSPMVVQGFHDGTPKQLKSYQYFYDTDGNQLGYVPAGYMQWDNAPTHHHWHFEDFAEYTLLDANKSTVVKSRKDGFCLADTDAIDYTVDGADWNPYNTDLQTACGDLHSPSVSEVLASGSGDTYEQFRAGQSFSLANLPNGIYYVSITANPNHVLTEQSFANNSALRKIRIGGTSGHRTVHVYDKGRISG